MKSNLIRNGERAAEAAQRYLNSANASDKIGNVRHYSENISKAAGCFEQIPDYQSALTHYIEAAQYEYRPLYKAFNFSCAARCCVNLGEHEKATKYYKPAAEYYLKSANAPDVISGSGSYRERIVKAAECLEKIGAYPEAVIYYLEAARYQTNNDIKADYFSFAARCYRNLNHPEKAAECSESSAQYRRSPQQKVIALTQAEAGYRGGGNLIAAARCAKNAAESEALPYKKITLLTRAIGYYRSLENPIGVAECSILMLPHLSEPQRVLRVLADAIRNFETGGDFARAAEAYLNLAALIPDTEKKAFHMGRAGFCYLELKAWPQAITCYEQAAAWRSNDPGEQRRKRLDLTSVGICYALNYQDKEAKAAFDRANEVALANAKNDPDGPCTIGEIRKKYLVDIRVVSRGTPPAL